MFDNSISAHIILLTIRIRNYYRPKRLINVFENGVLFAVNLALRCSHNLTFAVADFVLQIGPVSFLFARQGVFFVVSFVVRV